MNVYRSRNLTIPRIVQINGTSDNRECAFTEFIFRFSMISLQTAIKNSAQIFTFGQPNSKDINLETLNESNIYA